MTENTWTILDTSCLYDGNWMRLRRERCRTRTGDIIDPYLIWELPEWVLVIPITPDGQLVMMQHYRHAKRLVGWEFPTGVLESGESPVEGARRELKEETGYDSDRFEQIGRLAPNPAIQTNWMHVVVGRDLVPTHEPDLEPGEELEVTLIDPVEIPSLVTSGKFHHALNLAGYSLAVAHGVI